MEKRTAVLIAVCNEAFCAGIAESLQNMGCQVVGAVADGLAAIEQISALRPDVVVLDLSLSKQTDSRFSGRCRRRPGRKRCCCPPMRSTPMRWPQRSPALCLCCSSPAQRRQWESGFARFWKRIWRPAHARARSRTLRIWSRTSSIKLAFLPIQMGFSICKR